MRVLVIDCCIRAEKSLTQKFYQAYLNTLQPQISSGEIRLEKLFLPKEKLIPQDKNYLLKRDFLLSTGRTDDSMFTLARQFASADEIIIAAPYWDMSFPSFLKIYLENVSVSGITFGTGSNGTLTGLCKAKKILYFCTAGGKIEGPHLGVEYVKALGKMFGIPEVIPYVIDGLDIFPSQRLRLFEEKLLEFNF